MWAPGISILFLSSGSFPSLGNFFICLHWCLHWSVLTQSVVRNPLQVSWPLFIYVALSCLVFCSQILAALAYLTWNSVTSFWRDYWDLFGFPFLILWPRKFPGSELGICRVHDICFLCDHCFVLPVVHHFLKQRYLPLTLLKIIVNFCTLRGDFPFRRSYVMQSQIYLIGEIKLGVAKKELFSCEACKLTFFSV